MSCCNGHIEFSYAQKGRAMTLHFASDKLGLKYIEIASNLFCELLFMNYDIKVILGIIGKNKGGVMRLAERCGFKHIAHDSEHEVYKRQRK